MKFQKKMIILTTAAVATFGLIACGAAVADSKKDDGAVKPMAMKSTPAQAGMKGGCSHGAKGGKMGGCDHAGKGGKMGGCEQAAKMDCCDIDKKAVPAAAPKAESSKK